MLLPPIQLAKANGRWCRELAKYGGSTVHGTNEIVIGKQIVMSLSSTTASNIYLLYCMEPHTNAERKLQTNSPLNCKQQGLSTSFEKFCRQLRIRIFLCNTYSKALPPFNQESIKQYKHYKRHSCQHLFSNMGFFRMIKGAFRQNQRQAPWVSQLILCEVVGVI